MQGSKLALTHLPGVTKISSRKVETQVDFPGGKVVFEMYFLHDKQHGGEPDSVVTVFSFAVTVLKP